MEGISFSMHVDDVAQIVVFRCCEGTYRDVLAANPQMKDLSGDAEFQKDFPDIFIAGIKNYQ